MTGFPKRITISIVNQLYYLLLLYLFGFFPMLRDYSNIPFIVFCLRMVQLFFSGNIIRCISHSMYFSRSVCYFADRLSWVICLPFLFALWFGEKLLIKLEAVEIIPFIPYIIGSLTILFIFKVGIAMHITSSSYERLKKGLKNINKFIFPIISVLNFLLNLDDTDALFWNSISKALNLFQSLAEFFLFREL